MNGTNGKQSDFPDVALVPYAGVQFPWSLPKPSD